MLGSPCSIGLCYGREAQAALSQALHRCSPYLLPPTPQHTTNRGKEEDGVGGKKGRSLSLPTGE